MLMIDSPGAGKSMLAARLPSILPAAVDVLLEVLMIASVAGEIRDGALTAWRPFRSSHHSASMAALTDGGMRAKPGEISLAHQGVLFLDGRYMVGALSFSLFPKIGPIPTPPAPASPRLTELILDLHRCPTPAARRGISSAGPISGCLRSVLRIRPCPSPVFVGANSSE